MKRTKPKIVKLPKLVSMWRRSYQGGTVVVYSDVAKPITLERVNFLLDRAKQEVMGE